MRTTYLIISLVGALSLSEPCIAGEPTGSDVRAVIDGKYALTSKDYAKYQKCIASIELGADIKQYAESLEACKTDAKKTAYVLSEEQGQQDLSSQSPQEDSEKKAQRDRAWQRRTLKHAE